MPATITELLDHGSSSRNALRACAADASQRIVLDGIALGARPSATALLASEASGLTTRPAGGLLRARSRSGDAASHGLCDLALQNRVPSRGPDMRLRGLTSVLIRGQTPPNEDAEEQETTYPAPDRRTGIPVTNNNRSKEEDK